ncbi:MAG TPA: hypothetical protein VJN93_09315 [Candidatus Acidoferrum sp.]|nr:hypothetical protein [Candidatus Acidoferrum sp.]
MHGKKRFLSRNQRGTFPFGETWYTPSSSAPWVFGTYYRDAEAEGNDYAQARTYVGGLGISFDWNKFKELTALCQKP